MEVDTSKRIRRDVPKAVFGFNVPWRDFQIGHSDATGAVRSDVIALLQPFAGASYRYPGGNVSNWFDWTGAGLDPKARAQQLADFDRRAQLQFGPKEFARFVSEVDGVALITLNIAGKSAGEYHTAEADRQVNSALNTLKRADVFGCVGGRSCRLIALEFGNEMDWPPYRWSGPDYAQRVASLIPSVSKSAPEAKLVVHGATAPWALKDGRLQDFNGAVADTLARSVSGIAIHPYYDGITVPDALRYTDKFSQAFKSVGGSPDVYITEHARWPSMPKTGPWQQNWFMATGVGGAVSTADFQLGIISMPNVVMSNWHALGMAGPWQLLRVDSSGAAYPTPVYWALKTLREAFLSDVYKSTLRDSRKPEYAGGYNVRVVVMGTGDDSIKSVLGVNRSSSSVNVRVIDQNGEKVLTSTVVERAVSSEDRSAENTESRRDQITQKVSTAKNFDGSYCAEANSVFSLVEAN
ncbi:hypothetical protein [Aquincola sp. J276]|uniref:hypothetical protein n=1 Tax=Aquincola sp. J276 TaxID=2898432 RepID=UPI002150ECEA|nr:hypothetical protein [Aquincola sp. J276]MCR5866788.1 hypothetical protein [Aquincola sp. J276]